MKCKYYDPNIFDVYNPTWIPRLESGAWFFNRRMDKTMCIWCFLRDKGEDTPCQSAVLYGAEEGTLEARGENSRPVVLDSCQEAEKNWVGYMIHNEKGDVLPDWVKVKYGYEKKVGNLITKLCHCCAAGFMLMLCLPCILTGGEG